MGTMVGFRTQPACSTVTQKKDSFKWMKSWSITQKYARILTLLMGSFSAQNLSFFVFQMFHFYQAIWRHRLMWYNGTGDGLPEHPFLFLNKLQSKPMNFVVRWLIRFKSMRFQRNILWIHGREEARLPSALDSKTPWEVASFNNKIVQSNANPT